MEIHKIVSAIQDGSNVSCRLYFSTKKSDGSYISYSPLIEDGVAERLMELIVTYMNRQKELPVTNFSPIGHYDETLEYCTTKAIQSFQQVIDSFEEEKVEREGLESGIINKLNFYCLSVNCIIDDKEKNVMFFRRITKFKKLSSKGMFGQIKNNRFSRIEAEMLGVDGDIDTIVLDDEVIIFNHISLERIFSMNDQYIKRSKEAIEKIEEADRIENFEQFEEDCKSDRRITRILTRLLSEEDKLEHCFENFTNVKKAIDIFELDIKINVSREKETILYERKDQLMDVVRLIRDSYYRSIIQERTGVDDSI